MLLIISAIIIIVTPIIFCKAVDGLPKNLEEMRRIVNSKNSKF